MWTLSVEVTFYLVLPLLALLGRRLPVGARVPVIAVVTVASLAWGCCRSTPHRGTNFLNWPPAYASWFAAGMLLAEYPVRPVGLGAPVARNPWLMAGIALVAYLIAASPLARRRTWYPGHARPVRGPHRVGADGGGVLLAPLVLDRPGTRTAPWAARRW